MGFIVLLVVFMVGYFLGKNNGFSRGVKAEAARPCEMCRAHLQMKNVNVV